MRRSAWFMVILGAAAMASVGCSEDPAPSGCPAGTICPDAGGGGDADVPDTGTVDAGMPTDAPLSCSSTGRAGAACRRGACAEGMCQGALGGMMEQVVAVDPANPVRFTTMGAPTTPIPLSGFAAGTDMPGMCLQQCNSAAAADTCGSCAKCSQQMGTSALGFSALAFLSMRNFGLDTGICRAHCDFDVDTNGGCPEGFTCDAFTNLCMEGCQTDAQCSAVLVVAEDTRDVGAWVVPDTGLTCDPATDRCRWTNSITESVGIECEGSSDCTADVGVCLRGGTCAETQCGSAPDTMMDFTCDGGRGVCLGTGGNNGSLCLQGCNTAADCNPGNACVSLGMSAGPFSGYCFGICDTVNSGADDQIINCRTDEQCDMPEATTEDPDPSGSCRTTCDPAATPSDCGADEFCDPVAGETYGFCRPQGNFCFSPGSEDCFGDQICDNEAVAGTYGFCVDRCDAAAVPPDCAAPQVCQTSGELEGLCATPCLGMADCPMGFMCRIPVGMTSGVCVNPNPT